MSYQSQYTGAQIDEAVGKALSAEVTEALTNEEIDGVFVQAAGDNGTDNDNNQ